MPNTIIIRVDPETIDRCFKLMEESKAAMDTPRLITNFDHKSTITAAPMAGAAIEAMNIVRNKNVYYFNCFINDLGMVKEEMSKEDSRIAENIPNDLG